MPVKDKIIDVSSVIEFIDTNVPDTPIVFMENVHAMPKQGVTSMFNFGKGFGQLIGMCQAMGWDLRMVTPQAWKKVVLKDTSKDKDAAIAFVEDLGNGPNLVPPRCRRPHDGMADAVCICHYGRIMA